jgi:hypothetical protein
MWQRGHFVPTSVWLDFHNEFKACGREDILFQPLVWLYFHNGFKACGRQDILFQPLVWLYSIFTMDSKLVAERTFCSNLCLVVGFSQWIQSMWQRGHFFQSLVWLDFHKVGSGNVLKLLYDRIFNMDSKRVAERTHFLLQFLDLPRKWRLIMNLSGGQQRSDILSRI